MALFWMIGGKYSETHLQEIVGNNEKLIGPFCDYETAKEEWTKHALAERRSRLHALSHRARRFGCAAALHRLIPC